MSALGSYYLKEQPLLKEGGVLESITLNVFVGCTSDDCDSIRSDDTDGYAAALVAGPASRRKRKMLQPRRAAMYGSEGRCARSRTSSLSELAGIITCSYELCGSLGVSQRRQPAQLHVQQCAQLWQSSHVRGSLHTASAAAYAVCSGSNHVIAVIMLSCYPSLPDTPQVSAVTPLLIAITTG